MKPLDKGMLIVVAIMGVGLITVVATTTMSQRTAVLLNFGPPACEPGGGRSSYAFTIVDGNNNAIGDFSGNYSKIKTILVYQHDHYGLNKVRGIGLGDNFGSLDEYLQGEDSRCGMGTKIMLSMDELDPTATPISLPTPSPTPYDYTPWRI